MPYATLEKRRAAYPASRAGLLKAGREWRARNKDKVRQHKRDYLRRLRADPVRQAKRTRRMRDNMRERRIKTLMFYGGKCCCCGETELGFLTFDHIHGRKNTPKKCRTSYRWLLERKRASIQVLCYNCNCAKGFLGACPHRS